MFEEGLPPPKPAAGIRDHSPSSPSIPSAVLPHVQYQTQKCFDLSPFADRNHWEPVGWRSVNLSGPRGKTTFPAWHPPLPYPKPADRVRRWSGQPMSFNFTSLCVQKALLITDRPCSVNLIAKMTPDKTQPLTSSIVMPEVAPVNFVISRSVNHSSLLFIRA